MQFPSSFPLHAHLWGKQWHNQPALRKAQLLAALQVQTGQGRAVTKTCYWLSTGKHSSLTLHHHSRNLRYLRISSNNQAAPWYQAAAVLQKHCFQSTVFYFSTRFPARQAPCWQRVPPLSPGQPGHGLHPHPRAAPFLPPCAGSSPVGSDFPLFKFIFLYHRGFPSTYVCVIYWVSFSELFLSLSLLSRPGDCTKPESK